GPGDENHGRRRQGERVARGDSERDERATGMSAAEPPQASGGPSTGANIAALFVGRPVMTSLVMLGILIFGIVSYRLLPVNALPNVNFPTIQVSASLP